MAEARDILFAVDTPYPGAPRVVCYRDSWNDKLVARAPSASTDIPIRTLAAPAYVCIGTTNENYVVFVNHADTSPSGSPFVVIIDPSGNPLPAIVSIGYRRDFKDSKEHSVLWPLR